MTGFLNEFPPGGSEGIFTDFVFAFGDGPGAEVLVLPEGAAGMDEKHFKPAAVLSVKQNSGVSFGIVAFLCRVSRAPLDIESVKVVRALQGSWYPHTWAAAGEGFGVASAGHRVAAHMILKNRVLQRCQFIEVAFLFAQPPAAAHWSRRGFIACFGSMR